MDVLVVGGGFWGSAVKARLGERAHLVDAQHPTGASRNAAGIVDWAWYRQSTVRKMLPDWWGPAYEEVSRERLSLIGALPYPERFYSYQNSEPRMRGAITLAPNAAAGLVDADEAGHVRSIEPGFEGGWLVNMAHRSVNAPQVVLAAGVWTDQILAHSGLPKTGVRPLRGRALLVWTAHQPNFPTTLLSAPYRHYTVRPWADPLVRLGDTVERTRSERGLESLRTVMKQMVPDGAEMGILDGWRPVLPRMVVERIRPGLIVATGGHRVGLGMAGGVARRVEELL